MHENYRSGYLTTLFSRIYSKKNQSLNHLAGSVAPSLYCCCLLTVNTNKCSHWNNVQMFLLRLFFELYRDCQSLHAMRWRIVSSFFASLRLNTSWGDGLGCLLKCSDSQIVYCGNNAFPLVLCLFQRIETFYSPQKNLQQCFTFRAKVANLDPLAGSGSHDNVALWDPDSLSPQILKCLDSIWFRLSPEDLCSSHCFSLFLHNRSHIGCQSLSPIFTPSWFV